MKSIEMNYFPNIIKKLTANSTLEGIRFKRISDCITEMNAGESSLVANIVMPYSGMGIFYFGVPKKELMSMDNLPKSMLVMKQICFFKLNYCLNGRVEVFMRGKGKYAFLEEGMVAFDRNDAKTILSFSKENYRGFGLYFNFDIMSEEERMILSSFGITKEKSEMLIDRDETCFVGNASSEFKSIVDSIVTSIDDRSLDMEFARIQVTRLVYLLLNDDVIPLRQSEYTTAGQRRLAAEAEKMILENTGVHLTAEDIALKLNCSAPTLKKYFRKVYGVPMYTFLQDVRMKKAGEYLKDTKRPIADIAYEAGYLNQSKFCSLFKKTYGVTPSEYRRLNS